VRGCARRTGRGGESLFSVINSTHHVIFTGLR